MADVEIRTGGATTNDKAFQMLVDGHDVTESVLAAGFSIAPSSDGPDAEWVISMSLAASSLALDLPAALLAATVVEDTR